MSISLTDLIRLESAVWEALKVGDAEGDADLLADDFLGVYPTGYADKNNHSGQLGSGPTVAWYELDDVRQVDVSKEAALISYRASYRRPGSAPTSQPEVMYVSSLWCLRDGRWINTFSQDTPASEISVP